MEENKVAQEEELEVLTSIYEGDEKFKAIDANTFQCIFGVEGEKGTVLLTIKWPSDYPAECPTFSLEAFYNRLLSGDAKRALIAALNEESEKNKGEQQTYTMIEWTRDNYMEILTPFLDEDPDSDIDAEGLSLGSDKADKGQDEAKLKVKKEQLTKSQKRREWDKVDSKGEKARGCDWVDVVKHLSQTGPSGSSRPEGTGGYSTESYLPSCDLPS